MKAPRSPDSERDDLARLRAEWLQFRANLFDPESGLPTLSSSLDLLRRQLEEGRALALFTISLGPGRQAEEVWGWQEYDEMVRDLIAGLKEGRGGEVPEGLLCLPAIRSDEAFLFSSASNGNGTVSADEIAERARRLEKYVRDRFAGRTGAAETKGSFVGASLILFDPKVRVERMIYRAIREARSYVDAQNASAEIARTHALRAIIAESAISPVFQPIWNLGQGGGVVAFEALSRGPRDSGFDDGESLFSFAERAELLIPLERVCRKRILEEARQLPSEQLLFINLSPAAASDDDFLAGSFEKLVRSLEFEPAHIVLEITERTYSLRPELFRNVLLELRREGFRLAVDDIGTGYASFSSLAEIQPDYLKFDSLFVHEIHRHRIKRDLLDAMLTFAKKSNTRVIAEGIETEEELSTLRELGVPLGQGYLLARPAPAAEARRAVGA